MKTVLMIVGVIIFINVLFVIFALAKSAGDDERKRENEYQDTDSE